MEENTHLGSLISNLENDKLANDANAKEVLADKEILSRILKGTMREFDTTELDAVKNSIAPEVAISDVMVNPGVSNKEKVKQDSTEDKVNGEGTIYYDLRTYVNLPNNDIKILINVEAQKSNNPGYNIETRAIWYCNRMLSSQLDVEFTNKTDDPKKYANIKKVYSIWIVINPPQYLSGTIKRYYINSETVFEEKIKRGNWSYKPYYDLMEAVIIYLYPLDKPPANDSENELIGMLTTLFQIEEISAEEKKKKLQENYHLKMTNKIEKAVNQMCNYSEAIEEVKEAKAIAKVTARLTAQVTEKVTAQVTEKITAQVTEKVTAQVTEKVTEKVTAQVTEKKDKETVINMLKEGLGIDMISRVTKLTYDQVTNIGKRAMLL